MKKITVIFLITLLLFGTLACADQSILGGINQVRLDNGLNQLEEKQELDDFAQYRFEQMNGVPSHNNFKSSYLSFMHTYFVENNIQDAYYGEIIGFSDKVETTENYINAWMNSPTHRETILKDYVNIGSYSGYENNLYIVVVEFERLIK